MKKFNSEQKSKALESTPEAIQDILFSEAIGDLIAGIASKYGLTATASVQLSALIFYYLTKLIDAREFVNELFVLVSDRYFNQFRQELEDKLFSPYDAYMQQAGVMYKQITKLEPKKVVEPEKPRAKPQSAETVVFNVPPVSPVSSQVPQTSPQSNVIVIGETQAKPEPQPVKPAAPQPTPLPPQRAARIKVASGNLPPGLAIQALEPTPIRPEIKEVKFEIPQTIAEIASEIIATTPGKDFQVPKPPGVPKTTVQGKEVVDLTDFSVKNQ